MGFPDAVRAIQSDYVSDNDYVSGAHTIEMKRKLSIYSKQTTGFDPLRYLCHPFSDHAHPTASLSYPEKEEKWESSDQNQRSIYSEDFPGHHQESPEDFCGRDSHYDSNRRYSSP